MPNNYPLAVYYFPLENVNKHGFFEILSETLYIGI